MFMVYHDLLVLVSWHLSRLLIRQDRTGYLFSLVILKHFSVTFSELRYECKLNLLCRENRPGFRSETTISSRVLCDSSL